MAPQGYLFVNKHSNSPSLSRNTGSEASLASKVNKHVQQQRFWKSSEPRKNWYRPFIRSDSSEPSTPTETSFHEEMTDFRSERNSPKRQRPTGLTRASMEQQCPISPQRPTSSRQSASTRQPSRSVPELPTRWHTLHNTTFHEEMRQDEPTPTGDNPTTSLSSRLGDVNDPFNHTVVQITPELRDVLDRHLRWAVSSSVSDFAIKEGIQRIFESILTDRMHSAAFLAMATAQQRKTSNIALTHENSPEFYSYKATKIIREYIESHPGDVEPYTFVDIFRLAMCEWINGNHRAARIHFSYIARNYNNFKPHTAGEWHIIEVISSEDLFMSIDVDEKPLMELNWEPEMAAESGDAGFRTEVGITSVTGSKQPVKDVWIPSDGSKTPLDSYNDNKLISHLSSHSTLRHIISTLLAILQSFPGYSKIDFGAATTGPLWTMKRRIHAALHRLQSLDVVEIGMEQCIRRTLLTLLFLASTTPARRVGRTDVQRLASRLRSAMVNAQIVRSQEGAGPACPMEDVSSAEPGLLLWMFITGLVAAKEGQGTESEELVQWFRKRAIILAVQACGRGASAELIEEVLGCFLTFSNVHQKAIEELCTNIKSQTQQPGCVSGGFRIVDGPL